MGKDLIIVESPAKVKTIKKFLGGKYMVQASVGHIRDLPTKEIGVDEDHDFAPRYQTIQGKEKVVHDLQEAASRADTVYLAPDPDREGEAIAWHLSLIHIWTTFIFPPRRRSDAAYFSRLSRGA